MGELAERRRLHRGPSKAAPDAPLPAVGKRTLQIDPPPSAAMPAPEAFARELADQTAVVSLQAFEQSKQIQDASLVAMTERYNTLLQLLATKNPSDPEVARIRAELDAEGSEIRMATWTCFAQAIAQHGMFMVAGVLSHGHDPEAKIREQRARLVRYVEPDADEVDARRTTHGHSGAELHSHFMGNVEPEPFMRHAMEKAKVPTKSGPNWEPLLREIAAISDPELVHKYGTNGEIAVRGRAGDAIANARAVVERVDELRAERAGAKPERQKQIDQEIQRIAKDAVDKALRASGETDFNSAYEIRDELVKGLFGGDDRAAVLPDGRSITARKAELRGHFRGRRVVLERIERAIALEAKGKTPANDPELRQLDRLIREQFAYDEYAEMTVLRLVQDGLTYSEQSNSVNKLDKRFDEDLLEWIKPRLAAKHPDLAGPIDEFRMKHVAMINTSHFGDRDAPQQGDVPTNAKTRSSDAAFRADVDAAMRIAKRDDVSGIDIAGMEVFRFDAEGKRRMLYLVNEIARAARERGEPLVFRPHVGEGANDTVSGHPYGRDHSRQVTPDGELTHYARARENLDAVLDVLETFVAQPENADGAGRLPPELKVRFGHATHTTPEQAVRMNQLGVVAEVNLGSNAETGSVAANKPAPGDPDEIRRGPAPSYDDDHADRDVDYEDHALATFVFSDVPVILSTDGHAVMASDMAAEFSRAGDILAAVIKNEMPVRITAEQARSMNARGSRAIVPDGATTVEVRFDQMSADRQATFMTAMDRFYEDAIAYRKEVTR